MLRALQAFVLSCCLASLASACPLTVGVRAGSSIPDLRDNGGNEFSKGWSTRVGLFLGASAAVQVTPALSVQAELNYVQQGAKKNGLQAVSLPDISTTLFANFKNTAMLDYVEIPVLARLHMGPMRRFFADLGPYAGFLLSAKNVTKGSSKIYMDAAGQNELLVPVDENDPSQGYVPLGVQSLSGTTDNKSSLRTFNWGVQAGVGAEQSLGRGKVSLEVRGELGLINIQRHPEVDGRNSTGALVVALGYMVPLGGI
jgi:hypothetical protein